MKLSIIIVNFNTSELVKNCIDSISKYKPDFEYEIIIVDNSEKRSETDLLNSLKNSRIKIIHVANKGYGAANNEGAKIARGEYLLLLNPDTLMVDASVWNMLSEIADNSSIGALSPLIFQEDGKTLQHHFYGNFQSLTGAIKRKTQGKEIDLKEDIQFVDMVTGACLMVKKDLFDQVNGFDENFFMYIEDDDLCRRFADLGYKNAVYTKAKIIHLEGKSSTSKNKRSMYYKSQDYYFKKHYGIVQMLIMILIRWPYKTLRLMTSK